MTRAALALLLLAASAAAQEARVVCNEVRPVGEERGPGLRHGRAVAVRVEGDGPFDPQVLLAGAESPEPGGDFGEPSSSVVTSILVTSPPGTGGRVLLVVAAPGRAPALAWGGEPFRKEILVPAASPLDVRVVVAPPTGFTADAPEEKPVAGASVEITLAPGYGKKGEPVWVRRAKSGEDGVARFPDLPRGMFVRAAVRAPGFAPTEAPMLLPGGEPARVSLQLAARVAGRVVRAPGGAPAAGAVVRGGGAESKTGADGTFVLEGLAPGPVAIEAALDGMLALDRPWVAAESGKTAPVPDVRLAALGRVKVRIEDRAGNGLPGIPVRLLPADGAPAPPGPAPEVLTGSDGRAVVAPVAPAAGHRLVVEPRETWAPLVTDAFVVLAGEQADLGAIRVDAGGLLSGVVVDPDGHAIEGASLTLFDGEADPLRVAADPAAGGPLRRDFVVEGDSFRLDRIPAGSRSLLARAPGRLPAALTRIAVAAGREEKELRLVLRPGATVEGSLRGPDGEPVADALLVAFALPRGAEAGRARSGPKGRFRIDGLPAGSYALRVILPEESFPDPLRPEWPATAPGSPVEILLPSSHALEGVVLDPAGERIRGQVVVARLVPGAAGSRLLETAREVERIPLGPDGAFATRPLPEGRWRLRAECPDGRVASADVEVTAGTPARLSLLLAAGSSLRGRVLTGPVVKDLREVSVRLLLGGRTDASVPAAAVEGDGAFALHGVPAGEHDLVVSLPGLAPVVLRHVLVSADGGTVDVGDVLLGQGASLRLRVYGETRAPVAGAAAAVIDRAGLRREETTNAAGLALFGGLAEGSHVIEVRVPSGAVLRRPVEAPAEGEWEEVFDLGLDPPGFVEVRRAGGPVPGAVVRVLDAAQGAGAYAASVEAAADDRGVARVPGLPDGPVLLEVAPPGEPPVRLTLSVANGRVEAALPSDGVEGDVAAARDGAPVPGARVTAWPLWEPQAERLAGVEATADARGRFRFPSLPPGDWVLEARAKGFGAARVRGVRVLRGGGATQTRLLLEAAAALRGKVLDPAGRPVPGALVEATDATTGELLPGGRAISDSAGDYVLSGLAPGTFVATARAGGLGGSPPEILSLGAGEARSRDLSLVSGGTLEVRVVGVAGLPVPDALVEVRDFFGRPVPVFDETADASGPSVPGGRTDRDGVLRVPGLRAGVYRVRASKGDLSDEVRVRVDSRGGSRAIVALVAPR